jgi:integrase
VGWVEKRVTEAGRARYTAMFRDLKGDKRSAGTFSTERRAAREWQRAEVELADGKITDRRRGLQTLRTYVETQWLPNHVIEATTRESYTYLLNRYILPELGSRRMAEILPGHVREWVTRMQDVLGARPPTIRKSKVVLDAIFTTALNDQITTLHPGKGVKTPPVATKPRAIVSSEQFDRIHAALEGSTMRLLVETDIETGLRWGELTELRPKDIDLDDGVITVCRVVVHLRSASWGNQKRFVVKQYPKDKEWRRVSITRTLAAELKAHIDRDGLGPDDLLFRQPVPEGAARRTRPSEPVDPSTLGLTEPNAHDRQYRHGTMTAYSAGCRCRHCKDAIAAYRASRRAAGRDAPRMPRTVSTDGHISNAWFRKEVWDKALATAAIGIHVTPHGLRHAHASWLLAGGADVQVVKERLGHGSILTTARYLHARPDAGDRALDALAAFRGASRQADAVVHVEGPGNVDVTELRRAMATFKEMVDSLSNQHTAT